MLLGEKECDSEIAYLLKYGKIKPQKERKRKINTFFDDPDYAEEKYREYQESNFNEYFTGSYKYCLWR